MDWRLPNGEPFVGAHYCMWYRGDWAATTRRDRGSRTIFSPIRGSYQSEDEDVIRQHIAEAREAGINTFCCSWKPPERAPGRFEDGDVPPWLAKGIENYENQNLAKLLRIAAEAADDRFFVTVLIELTRLRDDLMNDAEYAIVTENTRAVGLNGEPLNCFSLTRDETVQRLVKTISYLLTQYGQDRSWCRLIGPEGNSRQVIVVYSIATQASYDRESLGQFQDWLKRRYPSVHEANRAWGTAFRFWNDARPSLKGPMGAESTEWFTATVADGWSKVKQGVKDNTGMDIALFALLVGGQGSPLSTSGDPACDGIRIPEAEKGLDGFIDYGYGPLFQPTAWARASGCGTDAPLYRLDRGTLVRLCKRSGKFSALTCIPGFDSRYVLTRSGRADDFLPRDAEHYRKSLGTIISLGASGIFITSYNEWWENTAIEPAREFGHEYLDICRQYARAFKRYAVLSEQVGFQTDG